MEILTALSRGLEGRAVVAMLAAFGWGAASVVLSPCHLASLPLLVAFVGGQRDRGAGRAFGLSLLFGLGVLVTIAALGLVSAAAGWFLGDVGPLGGYLVAALLMGSGLHLLGVIRLPLDRWVRPASSGQAHGRALVLGLLVGTALGPCTFAYLAPVLAVTFRVSADSLALAVALLLAYSTGHCAVLVAAGTATDRVQRYLRWSQASRAPRVAVILSALALIAAGFYVVWSAR